MTVTPFQLNKSQRLLANGTAKESDRPILEAIHVRKGKDGKGVAEVADSYILVQKQVDYDGDESVLLYGKDVAACKDDKQLGSVSFIPDGESAMQAIVEGGTRSVSLVSGTFPETERLFLTTEPVFKIGLRKDTLLKVLKCLDEKNGENDIAFFFYGTESPVEFRVRDDVRGLIMPLHIDWTVYEKGKPEAEQSAEQETE